MVDQNIVEIYSAANAIEAYAVANALEAAGITVHVVGEFLGAGAGGFLLGLPIGPRVWVLKEDEGRAREILEQLETAAENAPELEESEEPEPEIDKYPPAELSETTEEPLFASTPSRFSILLNALLGTAGLACIILGIFYAIDNHLLLNHYSKTVQAELIDRALYSRWLFEEPMTNYPWSSATSGDAWKEYFWKTFYAYEVNGVLYTIEIDRESHAAPNISIRYNPEKPIDFHVGAILHPAWCLFIGGIFGCLVLFFAYQFR